jgi:hypothetical protein
MQTLMDFADSHVPVLQSASCYDAEPVSPTPQNTCACQASRGLKWDAPWNEGKVASDCGNSNIGQFWYVLRCLCNLMTTTEPPWLATQGEATEPFPRLCLELRRLRCTFPCGAIVSARDQPHALDTASLSSCHYTFSDRCLLSAMQTELKVKVFLYAPQPPSTTCV